VIAVLTTVRNGMPFLEENLAAVRAQRFRDFFHVVVDDASTDGTAAFLAKEGSEDLRVIASPPVGRGRALNIGWRAIDADVVAILDADDAASPAWLAEMGRIMADHPHIDVLTCRGVLAYEHMESTPAGEDALSRLTPDCFLKTNPVHHSGTLIRRSALEKAGGYDEGRRSLFDYALWIALLEQGGQIWRVDRGYIFKRIHARQHFEARDRLNYLAGCLQLRRRVSANLLAGSGALMPYLAFVYGLLPQEARHWFRYWRHHGRRRAG